MYLEKCSAFQINGIYLSLCTPEERKMIDLIVYSERLNWWKIGVDKRYKCGTDYNLVMFIMELGEKWTNKWKKKRKKEKI